MVIVNVERKEVCGVLYGGIQDWLVVYCLTLAMESQVRDKKQGDGRDYF